MTTRLSVLLPAALAALTALPALSLAGEITFDTPVTLDSTLDEPWGVQAVDIDGDLDLDLLVASLDAVVWYENTDGMGTFGTSNPVVLGPDAGQARTVCGADLDGDMDVDVLVGSPSHDDVFWYENTDGLGTFGPPILLSRVSVPWAAIAADLDGDDDMDVITTALGDNTIGWNENTGSGTFGPRQVISALVLQPVSLAAVDIDGDDDIDVLAASIGDNKVTWYENLNAAGSFGVQQIITTAAAQPLMVSVGDLDGDLDPDVIVASQDDDTVAWYENTDGAGTFGPETTLSTILKGASSGVPVDMDNDGDLDVLIAGQNDDTVSWFENTDGAGTFSTENVISTDDDAPKCAIGVDFDSDGDADVVVTSYGNDELSHITGYLGMWVDLGNALAGTGGKLPNLVGDGVILPGNTIVLRLDNAKATSTVALIVGLGTLNLPLKGGTIVPTLDLFLFGTTNGNGKLNFAGPWPAIIPSGFIFYCQEWIIDTGGVAGFAASNGLRGRSG
jgi:hypothetical protein